MNPSKSNKIEGERLVNRFIQTGELHGDGRCEGLAHTMQDDSLRRRMNLADAFDRCREWSRSGTMPAWQKIQEGVHKTAERLVLQVMESGRLAARWGENLLNDSFPVESMGTPEPALVALGDRDDLRLRCCSVVIEPGDSSIRCELRFYESKDGLIKVELHADTALPGRSIAELWRGEDLLQQLPVENGLVSFSRRLSPGSYRIILRVGAEQHEINLDIA